MGSAHVAAIALASPLLKASTYWSTAAIGSFELDTTGLLALVLIPFRLIVRRFDRRCDRFETRSNGTFAPCWHGLASRRRVGQACRNRTAALSGQAPSPASSSTVGISCHIRSVSARPVFGPSDCDETTGAMDLRAK